MRLQSGRGTPGVSRKRHCVGEPVQRRGGAREQHVACARDPARRVVPEVDTDAVHGLGRHLRARRSAKENRARDGATPRLCRREEPIAIDGQRLSVRRRRGGDEGRRVIHGKRARWELRFGEVSPAVVRQRGRAERKGRGGGAPVAIVDVPRGDPADRGRRGLPGSEVAEGRGRLCGQAHLGDASASIVRERHHGAPGQRLGRDASRRIVRVARGRTERVRVRGEQPARIVGERARRRPLRHREQVRLRVVRQHRRENEVRSKRRQPPLRIEGDRRLVSVGERPRRAVVDGLEARPADLMVVDDADHGVRVICVLEGHGTLLVLGERLAVRVGHRDDARHRGRHPEAGIATQIDARAQPGCKRGRQRPSPVALLGGCRLVGRGHRPAEAIGRVPGDGVIGGEPFLRRERDRLHALLERARNGDAAPACVVEGDQSIVRVVHERRRRTVALGALRDEPR